MKIILDIEKLLNEYSRILSQIKIRLRELPECRLRTRKKNGGYRYSVISKNEQGRLQEKYLPKSSEQLIMDCCEAAYLRKLMPVLEKEYKAINTFYRHYSPQDKYCVWNNLPEGLKQYVKPLFEDRKKILHDWEYSFFEHNEYPFAEESRYITKKGEAVRSRIELIVADILYDLGIPYRYECRLDIPSGRVYPDFTIMHPGSLELYYIEIFGMMDNPEYEKSIFSKIAKYAASGMYSNLIMFFDHRNSPLSTENIKKTLSSVFTDK